MAPLLVDALYCEEEHWEGNLENEDFINDNDDEDQERDYISYHTKNIEIKPPPLLEQDLCWDEHELISLLSKEEPNRFHNNLRSDPSLEVARRDAIDWILRVISHYSFSALTAVLAVNYLDRFLFSFNFQREKPWMTQLAAVACLSLAAKVEETAALLLLDFQVAEAKYVFEAKTIQRMEILVLSTLKWKMNPVTPLSFVDYITRRLGLKHHLCLEFLKRCQYLLLSLLPDSRFMCCLPSVMATAAMLHVINNVEPCIGIQYQKQLISIVGVDKDKVEDCCGLILELASRGNRTIKRKFASSIPGSPSGVMDVSFSSDGSNDSWAVISSVSSSPEPLSKKSKFFANIC